MKYPIKLCCVITVISFFFLCVKEEQDQKAFDKFKHLDFNLVNRGFQVDTSYNDICFKWGKFIKSGDSLQERSKRYRKPDGYQFYITEYRYYDEDTLQYSPENAARYFGGKKFPDYLTKKHGDTSPTRLFKRQAVLPDAYVSLSCECRLNDTNSCIDIIEAIFKALREDTKAGADKHYSALDTIRALDR